jgi:signal transduction histidine kinase
MRSIATKLTLAFLLVGLTGAILVAVIVQVRTRSAFNQFLLNREQQALVNSLVQYYQRSNSWQGVIRDLVETGLQDSFELNSRDLRRDWNRFVLVGSDGRIIFSPQVRQIGQQISARDLEKALTLESGGEMIGWLLLEAGSRLWVPDSAEALFLRNLTSASLLSALVAVLLALVLGGLLAYTLTRSLRELTEATVEIADGKLGKQVKVRTQDELGELAASFNRMSKDLERATQARRQMTADIAHDLRSPLSVLTGYSEALSDGKLVGDPEIYQILNQETRHLGRLIDDLRTLSLADSGELPLLLQSIAPAELIIRAANAHRVQAEACQISMTVDAEPGLPEIRVDVERMAQVLGNLLRNALRYTPEGGKILLSARRVGEQICLAVRDTGIGISPQDLPYIFDRSYRGDQARQSGEGETGLGLAIVRSLVEAQGGTIEVESQVGTGSTFKVLFRSSGQTSGPSSR